MPIKWYNWIDMERIIDSIITDIPKKKIKEQFCKTFKHPKFGLIELNIQNNILNIEFKKCINIDISEIEEDDNCSVCFDTCNTVLTCNHHICRECAVKWIKNNNSCPICRGDKNLNTGFEFNIPMKALKQILI